MFLPPTAPFPVPCMPPFLPTVPPPPYTMPPMGMIPRPAGMVPMPMVSPFPMTMPVPMVRPGGETPEIISPAVTMPVPMVRPGGETPEIISPAVTMPASIPLPPQQQIRKESEKNPVVNEENSSQTLETNNGPPVTVFVGNITPRAPDVLILQILQCCGAVQQWKRVKRADGTPHRFGFCEYRDPRSALRCIKLLHDKEIGDRTLVVKVDAKTKERLSEYEATELTKWQQGKGKGEEISDDKKAEDLEKSDNENVEGKASYDELDEAPKSGEEIIQNSIEILLKGYEAQLSKPDEDTDRMTESNNGSPRQKLDCKETKQNDLDEKDREPLICREQHSIRDTSDDTAKKNKEEYYTRRSRSRTRDYETPQPRNRQRRSRSRTRDYETHQPRNRQRSSYRESNRSESVRSRDSDIERKAGRRDTNFDREGRGRRSRGRDWRDSESRRERHNRERPLRTTQRKKWEEDDVSETEENVRRIIRKKSTYEDHLPVWESREQRKMKEREKEKVQMEEEEREKAEEVQRLKEFFEDYDDMRDDSKYYKGANLERRLNKRLKEIDQDNLDRLKELEELRETMLEELHQSPEAEAENVLQETADITQSQVWIQSDSGGQREKPVIPSQRAQPETNCKAAELSIPQVENPQKSTAELGSDLAEEQHSDTKAEVQEDESLLKKIRNFQSLMPALDDCDLEENEQIHTQQSPESESKVSKDLKEETSEDDSVNDFSDLTTPPDVPMKLKSFRVGGNAPKFASSSSTSESTKHSVVAGKRKMGVNEVFNACDDEEHSQKKRMKLVPLDHPSEKPVVSAEEKKKLIKNLIDKIPTSKHEIFVHKLDWSMIDSVLLEKRIRPWIEKKMVEYFGEPIPSLRDFIYSKVTAGVEAQSLLDDMSRILDNDAELFIVKLWRMLIYETEAKKIGLDVPPQQKR